MQPTTQPLDIAIIGGGIGGLALAVSLKNSPHKITIYESAAAFGEIGAGVAFSGNALQALKLISPSLLEAYLAKADVDKGDLEERDHVMDYRMGMSVGGAKEGEWIGTVTGSVQKGIHRATFLEILVRHLPEGITKFRKRVASVEGEDRVKVHFEDGETVEHDAVIGCDGIKSNVRKCVVGQDLGAVFSGKYCYRGLVPIETAVHHLGEETARNRGMLLGLHGHLVIFPIAEGTIMNIVAFKEKKDGKWENNKWIESVDEEVMMKDFEGWSDSVRGLLGCVEKPDRWAVFNHPPPPTYHKNNVCLLGDAAHASSPHHGSGAAMALEDSLILSRLLSACRSKSSIAHAFKAYDDIRRPRDVRLVQSSKEAGIVRELEDERCWEGEKLNLKKLFEIMNTEAKWIWEEDLEKEIEAGLKSFKEMEAAAQ